MERIIDSKYKIVAFINDRMMEADNFILPEGIKIVNSINNKEIPEDEPLFIFRGRDNLSITTLETYKNLCELANCTKEQINGIEGMIQKFKDFRKNNPDKMKQPGSTMKADLAKLYDANVPEDSPIRSIFSQHE